jgi:hypothetical protein
MTSPSDPPPKGTTRRWANPTATTKGTVAEAEAAEVGTPEQPLETVGKRLDRRSPFFIGMTAAAGVYLLVPKIIGNALGVPALVTVVAVLLGGALLGVIGALVAVPVTAAVLLLAEEGAPPPPRPGGDDYDPGINGGSGARRSSRRRSGRWL